MDPSFATAATSRPSELQLTPQRPFPPNESSEMTGAEGSEEETSQISTVDEVVASTSEGVVGWKATVYTTEDVEMDRTSSGENELDDDGEGNDHTFNWEDCIHRGQ